MRTYEVVFVADPRLSEEEVVDLSQTVQEIIRSRGGEVIREESWGKRRLAYPINRLNEGRYVLLEVQTNDENPLPEVERRMQQNEMILRYLAVRTDAGRLRRRVKDGAEPTASQGPPEKSSEKEEQ